MREIYLGDGLVTLVSDIDYPWISERRWTPHVHNASGRPYVREQSTDRYLHRIITQCPKTHKVDHQDRDTLNNQRGNLRIATYHQNNANRTGWAMSGYKGVYRMGAKARARMTVDGVQKHLGTFDTEAEAAKAYDDAQWELYGEFAFLNFPHRYPLPVVDRPAFQLPPEF